MYFFDYGILWIIEKEREIQKKHLLLLYWLCQSLRLCRSQQNAQCLKFSKPGFNSTWTMNFQMFKVDLEKAEKPEIKLPISIGSSRKQESSRKTSALLTTPKPLTVWITTHWKILPEMGILIAYSEWCWIRDLWRRRFSIGIRD